MHVHALWEEIQHRAAQTSQRHGRPYLVRPCGGLHPWSLSQGAMKKRLYLALRLRRNLDRAAGLHFTTQAERDATAPLGLRAPAIIEPNGVDLREFAGIEREEARASLRELVGRHGVTLDRQRVVIFLGRLHPKKGLDVLVPAFADAVAAGLEDAVLVLAGPEEDAATAAMVRETALRPGMAGRIVALGMLHGRCRVTALAGADLFALTSYTENFGISVVEAMAAGTPVLISDGVELAPAVREAAAGEVIPVDRATTAIALRRWLGDAAIRAAAGARARDLARSRYDWDAIAGRWSGHYERLAGRATSAPA